MKKHLITVAIAAGVGLILIYLANHGKLNFLLPAVPGENGEDS